MQDIDGKEQRRDGRCSQEIIIARNPRRSQNWRCSWMLPFPFRDSRLLSRLSLFFILFCSTLEMRARDSVLLDLVLFSFVNVLFLLCFCLLLLRILLLLILVRLPPWPSSPKSFAQAIILLFIYHLFFVKFLTSLFNFVWLKIFVHRGHGTVIFFESRSGPLARLKDHMVLQSLEGNWKEYRPPASATSL